MISILQRKGNNNFCHTSHKRKGFELGKGPEGKNVRIDVLPFYFLHEVLYALLLYLKLFMFDIANLFVER